MTHLRQCGAELSGAPLPPVGAPDLTTDAWSEFLCYQSRLAPALYMLDIPIFCSFVAGIAHRNRLNWYIVFAMFPVVPTKKRGASVKKFAEVVSAIAAFALVGAASAADMPTKAPIVKAPMTVPVYNWTGFYVGAQAGWSRFHDSQVLTSPALAPLAVDSSADGFIGGGHAGYNFQMNQFVFGIEADFEGSSAKSTYPIPPPLIQPANGTVRLDWQGSVRGRLGIAADRVLFYGTGGWAFGRFTDGYFTPGTAFNESVSSIRDGWTAGAGIEYAFLNNFTARVEYRYVDWGTHTNNLNVYLSPPGTAADKITENAVRVGVSYKFAP